MYLYLLHNEYMDQKTNETQTKDRSHHSEILIRKALWDYCARQNTEHAYDMPAAAFVIEREAKGKPFFSGLHQAGGAGMPPIHFSVSHSGNRWACLIGAEPVGFDMEICRDQIEYLKIARRFFAEEEYDLVCSGGLDTFFDIWVRKEAYVKFTGSGLGEGLNRFSVAENGKFTGGVISKKNGVWSRQLCTIRPCDIAEGIKAAYCCGSGAVVKAVNTLDGP